MRRRRKMAMPIFFMTIMMMHRTRDHDKEAGKSEDNKQLNINIKKSILPKNKENILMKVKEPTREVYLSEDTH
jgi:hypothetical protein